MRVRNIKTGVVADLSVLPAAGWEPVKAPAAPEANEEKPKPAQKRTRKGSTK